MPDPTDTRWCCPVCRTVNAPGEVCATCRKPDVTDAEIFGLDDDAEALEPTDLYEEHGEAGA